MKKISLLVIVLISAINAGLSQKAPVVFGKITPEEVKMKVYEPDTSASAVVLYDYGWFDANKFMFIRTLRVKILKKSGSDMADFKYITGAKPSVRGMVYNMEGEEIIKEKLPSSSIFFKNLSGEMFETSFAIPNVKEGTVFDVQYTYEGLPFRWAFQSQIPVKYSELSIQSSPYLIFNTNFFGYVPLSVATPDRWVATNVPAFKSEPYINSMQNYLTKVEIELRKITYPGYFKDYASTWEDVNHFLTGNIRFPSKKQLLLCISPIVDELKSGGQEGEDLIRATFEAAKKMAYNNEKSIYLSDESLCSHVKLGSGNVADVNFLLLQLLLQMGFEASPVVLSSRSNGILSQFSPTIDKLDYLIVAVKNGEGYMLLDATEKYMPCNLLPDRTVNGNGRVITDDPKKSFWLPLVSKGKETSEYLYEVSINEDLTMNAKIKMVFTDYAAYDFRDHYATFNSPDEYAREAEKMNPGLIINDIKIEDVKDLYKPVTVTIDATIEGMAAQADNELYITPMLFEQVKESPFKAATRTYPISFSRLEDTKVSVVISLPENMSVSILPKTSSSKTRNNAVAFTYSVTPEEKKVRAEYRFNINSLTITPDQYKDVWNVYNNIVTKHAEPVILKIQ